ncbi:hypothetical protein KC19_11G109300 [Ceratodon purpureus]|uniref:Uncharacterized protein n=1 Tax=Ceratodon purpureus TaxID=3225 RepID=A0A8T0GET8_CERPU|nr:hypothetical protein KC19_11G109300 [Ceratodon purpureus]
MRSQLSVACVTIPSGWSHGCVVAGIGFPRALRREGKWQRCVVRRRLQQWKGRGVGAGPFAALGGNEAVELEQSGLRGPAGEGAVRGQEGLVSSVGTPAHSLASFRDWYMADKQLVVISFSAFVTAGFMTLLLGAAIPSLLAIKKAAEALEKLADTAREELPSTMAAIRLSGMEISDLTMELNDLGQEISKGVKSSARALNAAESGMRQVGGLASDVWQKQAVVPAQAMQPLVARTAKQVTESLVQTRTLVVNLQILSRVSSWIGSLQDRTPILAIPFQKKGQNS